MSRSVLPKGAYKRTPFDFLVQEILWDNDGNTCPLGLSTESIIDGYDPSYPVTIFGLTKIGMETKAAIEVVAALLGVPEDKVNIQGIKDKQACSSQLISVVGPFNSNFQHEQISLVQLYGQRDRLKRGLGYWGNYFTINVQSDASVLDFKAVDKVLNLWGWQRVREPGSEQIGKFLCESRFDEAAQLLLRSGNERALRRAMKNSRSGPVDALFHPSFEHYFGFEVEKWQSWLWNQLAQDELAKGNLTLSENERLPMWQRAVADRYRHLWDPQDKLSPEAEYLMGKQNRPTLSRPEGFQAKYKNGFWRLSFGLRPSAYATVILSQLFQLEEKHERQQSPIKLNCG